HGVEVLTDLIVRYAIAGEADHIFLIADAREAYVVEAAGRSWALLECRRTRAVTGAPLIRQDWRRLSPGLASHAAAQGWCREDGSKFDFAACVETRHPDHPLARRRWGRASVALAQQEGAIDAFFLRRLLQEHHDTSRDLLPSPELLATFVAPLCP